MSIDAAPGRPKQANGPLGGQRGHEVPSVGVVLNTALNRFKQASVALWQQGTRYQTRRSS